MNPNSERIIELFSQAMARQSAEERAAFLAEACRDEPKLREQVESLLRAEPTARDFLKPGSTTPLASFFEKPGTEFGDYELVEEIARGGMGVVYKARQISLDRLVAVKMLLFGPHASADMIRRFKVEAVAAGALHHPNIVAIHEVGIQEGHHFIVMDYVDGPNLANFVRNQPLTARRAAEYVKSIADAIHYAHEKGILHRDLKPSNILIDAQEQPRISDFGLARRLEGDSSLTLSGQVLGSPNFMPPEQAAGHHGKASRRSDVYGLGAILYCLLTGRPPFQGENVADTLHQVLNNEPLAPRLLNSGIPRDLETICLNCLEKEPARRYGTAQEIVEELSRFLNNESICARSVSPLEKLRRWCRRKPALAALIIALLSVGGAGLSGIVWQWQRATRHAMAESDQRRRAEATVTRLEIERAETLFRMNDAARALASLARVLRREPTNRVAAERLLSALSFRTFCLPVGQPLSHPPFNGTWEQLGYTNRGWIPLPLRHDGSISAAEFSMDGQRIVTACKDGTARVWSVATGLPLFEPLRHERPVMSARFSPNGQQIVTASLDGTARLWDALSGQPLTPPLQHRAGVLAACFSPDGALVLTGSEDRTARLWNASTGEPVFGPLNHSKAVASVGFSPDGKRFVTTAFDDSARIWDRHTAQPVTGALRDGNTILFASFSPAGDYLISGGMSWFLHKWDARTGLRLLRRGEHRKNICSGQFAPDGRWIATGGEDNMVRFWEAQTGEPLPRRIKHRGPVRWLEFSMDGRRLATASDDKTARVWDFETAEPVTEPLCHGSAVLLARFSPDGGRLLTVETDNQAYLWRVPSKGPFRREADHQDNVYVGCFSPDGQRFATGTASGSVCVWETRTGAAISRWNAHGRYLLSIRFSPDGKKLLTGSLDKSAVVWEAATGKKLVEIRHTGRVNCALFNAAATRVLTASTDGTACVSNAETGAEVFRLQHPSPLATAEFSADDRLIVTASRDKTARVWSATTGQPVGQAMVHSEAVNSARFSQNHLWVVTASRDKSAQVWNARTGSAATEPLQHDDAVEYAEFSAAGDRVATASGNSARVWDIPSGKPLTEPLEHEAKVTSVRFSRHGRLLVTCSHDRTARIWDVETGHLVSEPLLHDDAVVYAEFGPDDHFVLTTSMDGRARVWEVPQPTVPVPPWLAELAEAVAGLRFNKQNAAAPVQPKELLALKNSLTAEDDDWHLRWARRFLAKDPEQIR